MKTILLLLCTVQLATAQVASGSFHGRVTDETGGVVAKTSIVARQESTGFSRSVQSDDSGTYRIDGLAPGTYSISAERKGFRPVTATHARLEVNQYAKLDFELKVGTTSEIINVSTQMSLLETGNSTAGYRVDSEMMSGLPLDQRNVMSLVTLGPGAIPRQLGGFVHDVNNDVQEGSRGSVALNPPVNGARPNMNAFLLDGAYNTDRNTFAVVVIPPLEAVQEFRTDSSLASAAFSQAGGGVVDIVTKSGGRQFHASLFEYLRNEATDARNFFDDPQLARPIFRRNQYGASLSGPLPIRSTFFFLTYEALRDKAAKSSLQLVPNQSLRSGNFGQETIYDPLSLDARTGMRLPFLNNVIPESRIDPVAAKYLARFEPLPNRPGDVASNYLDATPSVDHHDSASGRVDHQFQSGGLFFGRFTINDDRGGIGGNFPILPTEENLRAQQLLVGYTFARSNLVNELRASFARLRLFDIPRTAFQDNVARDLGLSSAPSDPFAFGLPYFVVSNFSTVTDDPTLPQVQRDNTWNLSDGLTLVRGRHTWKMGLSWSYFQFNYRQSNTIRGQYNYTGLFTGSNDGVSPGDAFADFLLGYPQQTMRTVGSAQAYLRQTDYGVYLQDDWRVSSRLTLNLGVRYQYNSPFTEAQNKMLNLDYSTLPAAPRLVPVSRSFNSNWSNFAPRVGLAYRIPGSMSRGGDAVFRAGYGIYFSPEVATEDYDLVLNGIRSEMNTSDGTKLPTLTTQNAFPTSSSAGFPSYYGLDRHSPTPYVQQWNAGFQRELPKGILLDISYVASKGTHLGLFRRFNTPLHTETGENLDPRPGDLQSLRTFPDLGTIFQRQHIANSSYQSLQFKAEKRLHKSLSFLFSYVWSKSIDDATSLIPGLYDSAGAQDENNLRLERGLSFFDVRRRLSGGFVYYVPQTRRLHWLISNWQLSSIMTFQDGTPLDPIYFASDFANSGTPNRPDVVPGQSISLPANQRTAEHWFNTGAFQPPQPFHFGNAGRDTIPGPGNEVVDASLHRRFSISERLSFDFRADVFNLFNHPNLGIPGPYPDFGPFFGKILASGDPRRLQFSTRLEF